MYSPLGDSFPENFRKAYAGRQLKAGAVIKLYTTDTVPPKEKRFIVVGFCNGNKEVGIVYINSEINKYALSKKLNELHLEFKAKGRPYLNKNSFIDCSNIYFKPSSYLKNKLKKDASVHIGEISEVDLSLIHATLHDAYTIPDKHKIKLGLSNPP